MMMLLSVTDGRWQHLYCSAWTRSELCCVLYKLFYLCLLINDVVYDDDTLYRSTSCMICLHRVK